MKAGDDVGQQPGAEPVMPQVAPGETVHWELDGVSSAVQVAVQAAAHQTGESLGAWVERALKQALAVGGSPAPGATQRAIGLGRGKACRFARFRKAIEA